MGQVVGRLPAGKHHLGGGLYLLVRETGGRSWSVRWTAGGRAREMGLGAFPQVSLREARGAAAKALDVVRQGGDPIAARKRPAVATLGELAQSYQDTHGGRLLGPLRLHAGRLWALPVGSIVTADIVDMLRPIWPRPQAQNLRAHLERLFDAAAVLGLHPGPNPALWKGRLSLLLPRAAWTHAHHAAVPWQDLPRVYAGLGEGPAAQCVRFQILTAVRPGEARGARWDEIDGDLWRIPAARMKARREHLVPLSAPALELLTLRYDERIFVTSPKGTRSALERVAPGATRHGLRSSFRDWVTDTGRDELAAEACLAHLIGGAVERAYARSERMESRRALLSEWGLYVSAGESRILTS